MENQNQNNTNQPTQPIQPNLDNLPVEQAGMPNQPLQPQSVPPVVPEKPMSKIPKNLIFGGIAAFVVIILLIVSFMMIGGVATIDDIIPTNPIEQSPTPSPTPAAQSPYADDPVVLEIKSDIEEFDKKLNSTNLREETLRVPSLEWEINFK